jgi:hypothetical protein
MLFSPTCSSSTWLRHVTYQWAGVPPKCDFFLPTCSGQHLTQRCHLSMTPWWILKTHSSSSIHQSVLEHSWSCLRWLTSELMTCHALLEGCWTYSRIIPRLKVKVLDKVIPAILLHVLFSAREHLWRSITGHEILKCWNTEILKCWNTEILKCWNTEILKCWNTEMLKYWNTEMLKCWNTEMLKYWNTEMLKYWSTEMLKYWNARCKQCRIITCCPEILLLTGLCGRT